MTKSIDSHLKWLGLLFLTGITAGLVASVLTILIHLIQAISFGYHEGSFSLQIAHISPIRRFFPVILSGLVAAFGWYSLQKYGKPFKSISAIVKKQETVHPLSNFIHGMLQLITVSMGSPLGREGASREVAVALTATWLPLFHLSKNEISLILACASGAALGAVYNAPLATVAFIIESILLKWQKDYIIAAILSSFIAVWTVRLLSGNEIQYQLAKLSWTPGLFLWAIFAGIVISFVTFAYKALLNHLPKRDLTSQKFLVLTLIAFTLVAFMSLFFPEILGNGKAGLLYYLHHKFDFSYSLLLLIAKAIAVLITFYAGLYGGKIAPSMMMGGALGLLLGQAWNFLLPLQLSIPYAIIIGATLFLAIINSIPIAATLFLVEITGQPILNALPIALAVGTSLLFQRLMQKLTKRQNKVFH